MYLHIGVNEFDPLVSYFVSHFYSFSYLYSIVFISKELFTGMLLDLYERKIYGILHSQFIGKLKIF